MEQVSKKGIRVSKGESVMEAFQNAVPHWIHEKIEDKTYVTGYRYGRRCRCSSCGHEASFEKEICPGCGRKMQHMKGI